MAVAFAPKPKKRKRRELQPPRHYNCAELVNQHLKEDAQRRHPAIGIEIVRPENLAADGEELWVKNRHENEDPDQQGQTRSQLLRPKSGRGGECVRFGLLGIAGHKSLKPNLPARPSPNQNGATSRQSAPRDTGSEKSLGEALLPLAGTT